NGWGVGGSVSGSRSFSFGPEAPSTVVYANQQASRAIKEKFAVLPAPSASVTWTVRLVVPDPMWAVLNVAWSVDVGATATVQSADATCQRYGAVPFETVSEAS